ERLFALPQGARAAWCEAGHFGCLPGPEGGDWRLLPRCGLATLYGTSLPPCVQPCASREGAGSGADAQGDPCPGEPGGGPGQGGGSCGQPAADEAQEGCRAR